MKNTVQLVTYVDRLGGGGLAQLAAVLHGPLAGLFATLHLLPFFDPIDGADAGFDPIDHTQVDPRLGTWPDVRRLAGEFDIMADLIVNHLSSRSPHFRDFLQNGAASRYAGLFLTRDSVFPAGSAEADIACIHRPRPGPPFTPYTLAGGECRLLWTTFTSEQIDIDVHHPEGAAYLDRILCTFAANGIRSVRLDAVGYAIKEAGTSCFLLPATLHFMEGLTRRAHTLGIDVLVEVHAHFQRQIELAQHVPWIYDFALPPLVLHAFAFRTARYLREWIRIRPTNSVTVLDTHDGIGILDIGPDRTVGPAAPGLVPDDELEHLVDWIHANSGGASRRATGAAASNLDLYQVNCTFYDALGRNARRYLLARALQFFLPGVPQVYYIGLLAGENDLELLAKTGTGRDVNRHRLAPGELERALARPVVQDLLRLIRLRNSHPAFAGDFRSEAGDTTDSLSLRWTCGQEFAHLWVSFGDLSYTLEVSAPDAPRRFLFSE